MAKHLLAQHRAEGGEVYDEDVPPEGEHDKRRRDYLPYAPEVNVEDRREESYETPDLAVQFRDVEPTPREVLEFRGRDVPTSLGRELGYESVGQPTRQRHSFKESNPLPPDYLRNPISYLSRAAEFARLNPNYFETSKSAAWP